MSEAAVIKRIASVAQAFGWQAGVGGMETAGSIVSYLASHPEQIEAFLDDGWSITDWPINWHEQGDLTWHAAGGAIVHPEHVRRRRVIKQLEKGQ